MRTLTVLQAAAAVTAAIAAAIRLATAICTFSLPLSDLIRALTASPWVASGTPRVAATPPTKASRRMIDGSAMRR